MSDIKFASDYGYPPAAPFWLVWNEDGHVPMFKHASRKDAEAEASRLARENPGDQFHVLCVMSTISTSTDVVGQRFDPTRTPVVEKEDEQVAPAFVEVDALPSPADDAEPF